MLWRPEPAAKRPKPKATPKTTVNKLSFNADAQGWVGTRNPNCLNPKTLNPKPQTLGTLNPTNPKPYSNPKPRKHPQTETQHPP